MGRTVRIEPYEGPAGGWGSARSVSGILLKEKVTPATVAGLAQQNKAEGYACVSCAWPKPARPHPLEFCENGAKATAWELTTKRTTPEFFAQHTVGELLGWEDHALEQHGRLTHPMRYDARTDRYVPVEWDDAFAEIGRELKALDPDGVIFYASGRGSLETSYMYALLARMYGTNNLPDSSNMCHETTSVALKNVIGSPVGTVVLEDFGHTDCILSFGQNVGSNAPRMLHQLQEAVKRGCTVITFNPLKERGWQRFTNPQNPVEMMTGQETVISAQYHQVKAGGDIAALMGLCKWVVEADDRARAEGGAPVIDHAFVSAHTTGFEAFAAAARATPWAEIEAQSGLPRAALEDAARVYARSKAVMAIYGMGLTQHVLGEQNLYMLTALMLLRGNIGKPGAGLCPVRGHSNVQGQRTVGISEKPELVPLDKLAEQYGFEPPRHKGRTTVEACEGILSGEVRGFIGLGGNFVRAIPDTKRMEEAWRRMRLTVQVATKLNRSHLVNGEVAFLLPCLGRIERDTQAGGDQAVSVEDSTSCIHGSVGQREPASPHLRSEPAIVAGIAKATLPPNPKLDWDAWVGDYARVRDAIEQTYPDQFAAFNDRLFVPGGFHRRNAAREREWKTRSGKAEFRTPPRLNATGFADEADVFRLVTLRSNDQFNTTIYGYHDRFRGVEGTRMVLFINPADMDRMGLKEGEEVTLAAHAHDQIRREVPGLRVTPYEIPEGCLGGYYPECNPLIPVWHHAEESKTPAAKSVPVRVVRAEPPRLPG
ncbi:FdhF/YdeP family oxidoreductase [Roseomonas sp. OT10]|uniref:FdhF/YdeP family oxidoreductase n=1 Tax=Roseomonas cutis TaxID=2897332 RepID=UPI001E5399AC|nr:FdhF/YdeP family oxidoreductase [Roseomonas sp. OT10]UFN47383.1 FdhF/YdeP family oxidoreductase [Roseomonas sp. OT10]